MGSLNVLLLWIQAGGKSNANTVLVCFCATNNIHILLTSLIKIQPFLISSISASPETPKLCITATVSLALCTLLHGNWAISNHTVAKLPQIQSLQTLPRPQNNYPSLKKTDESDRGHCPSHCGPHTVEQWLEVWDQIHKWDENTWMLHLKISTSLPDSQSFI